MKTIQSFNPLTDRYHFDLGPCSAGKGFAQIDTEQDASYFGNWCNPFTLTIVSFAEGDISEAKCDTVEEFLTELREMDSFYSRFGIDPSFNEELRGRLEQIGAGRFLL